MTAITAAELEQHIPALEAGERLTLIHGGRPIAQVVPLEPNVAEEYPKRWESEEQRLAAVNDLMLVLREGHNLGGLKITDRASLYDRDE